MSALSIWSSNCGSTSCDRIVDRQHQLHVQAREVGQHRNEEIGQAKVRQHGSPGHTDTPLFLTCQYPAVHSCFAVVRHIAHTPVAGRVRQSQAGRPDVDHRGWSRQPGQAERHQVEFEFLSRGDAVLAQRGGSPMEFDLRDPVEGSGDRPGELSALADHQVRQPPVLQGQRPRQVAFRDPAEHLPVRESPFLQRPTGGVRRPQVGDAR
jgi:hypothetical protein